MRYLLIISLLFSQAFAQPSRMIFHMMNQSSVATDADAQAYINAVEAGGDLLTPTQEASIHTLVIGYKNYGIWTKRDIIYIMLGGTASAHKWNLKDPRDLDAAFRLTFFNSPTHSANGVDWNATDQYASTYYSPSVNLSSGSGSFTYWSGENSGTIGDGLQAPLGIYDGTNYFQLNITAANGVIGGVSTVASFTPATTEGYWSGSRLTTTDFKVFRNGVQVASNTSSGATMPTGNVFLGARSNSGTAVLFASQRCQFASFGDGLTPTEVLNEYNLVVAFQTANSR